jgi:hypothetical protein
MGAWNTDSGASIHAELIGREWVKAGHQLSVFTFFENSIHGTAITNKDEDYVNRCFTTSTDPKAKLNPIPFLKEDYEFFIVEDLGMLPQDPLGNIFHWIRKKAKTINIIHDGRLSEDPSFYQFNWDAVVGFDHRYIDFLKKAYPAGLLHQISYPCHPLTIGDKKAARKRLKLPIEKKILLIFGQAARTGIKTIPWILKYSSNYPLLILVVSGDKEALTEVRLYSRIGDIDIREEILTISQLYDYLHSCDALIFNKPSQPHVVVSSTVFQCLGSGCPIIARESNAIETLQDEVLVFRNRREFGECLIEVCEQHEKYKNAIRKAKNYVLNNSSKRVAERFIELFGQLRK